MGQKVNPIGFRLGIIKSWQSTWFAGKREYPKNLLEDLKIRKFLFEKLKLAGIVGVNIDRLIHKMKITIHVSRPGVVIGRGGSGLEELKKMIILLVSLPEPEKNVQIEVVEVSDPELSAILVATRIASELERRFPHRRVVKKTIERVMSAGAKGIKIVLSGRIAGAEISRRERFAKGKLPLSTIRANIDFAKIAALTRSGYIGVKVWIYK
ncbi:30S ribosomal protein S3 [Candidatus Shapirobacteria bacterium CG10_big_fil_rev_8_21_14_0_10_40_9]|uniref:Small ribosomal subunit protein uS3 n=1 Tax=Candidatus Shapirobacteria bacterium CG10_big_fil_rev_8_21_14_0_10_40_9 TaxID=1974888 RepID=A0A2M8L365_9BACT|nr:MAG: 30S ribosomal protein S3 [Candidatus Shapirobacteria bacterium CG10_big_fil_rev_8_21_14_0_10_40_9]